VPSNPYLGVLAGTRVLDWVPCDTELRGFVVSGSAPSTQPSNPTGTNFAKYLDLGNGLILFKFHFVFDANSVFGTGEHIWAVRLPVPANRASGGADLTDGTALAWQGSAANPQLCDGVAAVVDGPDAVRRQSRDGGLLHPVLLPAPDGDGHRLDQPTTRPARPITHNVGSTPSAFDINVVPTATTGTNPGIIYVNNDRRDDVPSEL
jgi:hypothetical protein